MNRRIKVLMIGPARNQQGGITTVVNNYYKAGIENWCDITYLDCTCNGGKATKFAQGVRSLAWEWRHAREFDVVHVHMGGGNSFARERYFAMAGVRAGVPTVLHIHDGLFRSTFENASDALRKSYRKVFSAVDCVVALSDTWKRYFEENVTRQDNVIVVPNGVCIPKHVNMDKKPCTVLFLGHFDDNKNACLLIRAIAKVRERASDIRCFFGADGDVERGKSLIAELDCGDECLILGWVDATKKQELLDKCSIYCLPSKNEAFPMGLLEAMANGCTAVVTPVGGMVDIVEDKKTGVFVPVDDVNALADALVALVRDENSRREIAEAGASMVRKRYDLNGVLEQIIEMYESLNLQMVARK